LSFQFSLYQIYNLMFNLFLNFIFQFLFFFIKLLLFLLFIRVFLLLIFIANIICFFIFLILIIPFLGQDILYFFSCFRFIYFLLFFNPSLLFPLHPVLYHLNRNFPPLGLPHYYQFSHPLYLFRFSFQVFLRFSHLNYYFMIDYLTNPD